MLTVTRKRGQSVIITKPPCEHCAPEGKKVQVVILGRHGEDHKIGVDAPKEYRISREQADREYNKDDRQLDLFTEVK